MNETDEMVTDGAFTYNPPPPGGIGVGHANKLRFKDVYHPRSILA